jgi:hypothetical protein
MFQQIFLRGKGQFALWRIGKALKSVFDCLWRFNFYSHIAELACSEVFDARETDVLATGAN